MYILITAGVKSRNYKAENRHFNGFILGLFIFLGLSCLSKLDSNSLQIIVANN